MNNQNTKIILKNSLIALLRYTIIGVFITICLALGVLTNGFFFLILIVLGVVVVIRDSNLKKFWKTIAENKGWKFDRITKANFMGQEVEGISKFEDKSYVYEAGISRIVSNQISGIIDNEPFKIFLYSISKRLIFSTSQKFTVFNFTTKRKCPNMFLVNKESDFIASVGVKISLPDEFNNKYTLSAPKEYETEALEIFTPDILVKILDANYQYNVEILDNKIIILRKGYINNIEDFEIYYSKALELKNIFSDKLNRFNFSQLGDNKTTLI